MKDQHTKIKGYRDLSQQEIDLMNEIKIHAEETRKLLEKVVNMRHEQNDVNPLVGESLRCLALAKTNLQQGNMWFVRAVAMPDSF